MAIVFHKQSFGKDRDWGRIVDFLLQTEHNGWPGEWRREREGDDISIIFFLEMYSKDVKERVMVGVLLLLLLLEEVEEEEEEEGKEEEEEMLANQHRQRMCEPVSINTSRPCK